jgi:DUF4097 and DUF4098 domain-containing protein YvlB
LSAFAAKVTSSDKITKEIPLDLGGSFWIDATAGNIEIIGAEVPNLQMVATKTVIADDRNALEEGREQTQISIEGDQAVRLLHTIAPPARNPRWSSSVSYVLRVPRYCHVRVASKSADRIRIANMIANVTVKSFNGKIILDGVSGATTVDSTNSSIVFTLGTKPTANAQMTTVNGDIEVHLPGESNFDWLADTVGGAFLTTLPVRGHIKETTLHASVNSPGGPLLTTRSIMGRIALLRNGTKLSEAKQITAPPVTVQRTANIRPQQPDLKISPLPPGGGMTAEATLRMPIVTRNFAATDLGIVNVEIGEIQGEARIATRAGSVQIEKVWGNCSVVSFGGPLTLGDIVGAVDAMTRAGDVIVRAAREGGRIATGGGNLHLLYTSGPTTLHSEGGDIVVNQAAAPIGAETVSGDITIGIDPTSKTQHIEARTRHGNVTLQVPPRFAADVDATVITSDADANVFQSDFPGLTVKREQAAGKTRVHITGKINGGGDRVMIYAEEGNVRISAQTSAPIALTP